MGDAKRSSSTAEAAKLACAEGLNSKNNSTLSSSVLNLVLLRHVVLKPKLVMPRESGRLGVLAGLVYIYVILHLLIPN